MYENDPLPKSLIEAASRIGRVKPVNEAAGDAIPDMVEALELVLKHFPVSELNVKKDYSKMLALAAANKALHKFKNGQ